MYHTLCFCSSFIEYSKHRRLGHNNNNNKCLYEELSEHESPAIKVSAASVSCAGTLHTNIYYYYIAVNISVVVIIINFNM